MDDEEYRAIMSAPRQWGDDDLTRWRLKARARAAESEARAAATATDEATIQEQLHQHICGVVFEALTGASEAIHEEFARLHGECTRLQERVGNLEIALARAERDLGLQRIEIHSLRFELNDPDRRSDDGIVDLPKDGWKHTNAN